ncbi:FG-GAP-like repeat-containing protein [Fimbriiglobus ruber]|uniref:Alkaline phosphatase n=1 Tax=Fimbriiglobus ruber TaxID=1908690 RepID=A0A225DXV0_9BACT|nr:FG-GAP-like repeat-containing protein [Fimbriiglobus ruber]OWK44404.1 Alkaline phosphatase [Fimbriiglobus ruber]
MSRPSSFEQLLTRLFGVAASSQRRAAARKPSPLVLQQLESRLVPATTVSIADNSVVEPAPGGTVNLDFTVTRTGDLTSQLTVGYTTVAGTAQANTDFTPETGTTTFSSGSATATISIPVMGNGVYEPANLTFSVQLTGVVNDVGPPVTFAAQNTFGTANAPTSVAIGDLNGDGKPDLVVAESASDAVGIFINTTVPGATTPSFAPEQTFFAWTAPTAVAIADVNGDGKPDIIAVNDLLNGSVTVLLNNTPTGSATASFPFNSPAQVFNVGGSPQSLAVADVNGDGLPDIVVANTADNTVSVLLNTTSPGGKAPSFATQQTFATGSSPSGVAVDDVNGDGKPDITTANAGDDTVSVLLNTTPAGATTAAFTNQKTFATGTTPTAVAVADVNGDGKPDLLVANSGANSVSVLVNTTPAGATTPSFATQQTFATGTQPVSLTADDLNGDGKPDLIVADQLGNDISVLVNTSLPGSSTPTFAAQQTFAAGNTPAFLATGDLNTDGLPDVVVANNGDNSLSVLFNTTQLGAPKIAPAFPTAATSATGDKANRVTAGDLNGDGLPDLVVANVEDGDVSAYLNETPPAATTFSFAAQQTFATGSTPFQVAIGDVNGDGLPDLVVSGAGGGVAVLLNTTPPGATTLSFAAPQIFATGSGPGAIQLADVNGDGKLDIVIADENSNDVSVLLNSTTPGATTPSFATAQTFAVGRTPLGLAVGDVNGDGLPDLIVTNSSDNTVSVLLNDTTPGATVAAFATQQTFATGSFPDSVALGDVNGDGLPDLVITNFDDNDISVLLNATTFGASAPTFAFATQQTFATGAGPNYALLGDVNGDGRPDVVVANKNENDVSVLLNATTPGASAPAFATQQTFATGALPTAVTLAQVNGDGRPDLAVVNFQDSSVSVLANTPATITRGQATGTIVESGSPPTVPFSTGAETVDASTGTFSVTVTMSSASAVDTTIPFTVGGTAVAGTDYSGLTASPLVVPAGQTTATITGSLISHPGSNQTLTLTLGTPTNATLGTTTANTLTITEPAATPPSVQFATTTEMVDASTGSFTVTVTLSAASSTDATIPFTVGGTAVAGTDYSGLTTSPLVIPAGQTTATITGTLTPEAGFDPTGKTLTLTLGTPTNATLGTNTTNTLTITEPAAPPSVQFNTAAETVNASAGTFSVTVNLSAASTVDTTVPFTIGGTAVAGTDYSGLTASPLVIPAGQTSATITGTLISHPGSDQTLTLTLGTPTNATLGTTITNTLTITEPAVATLPAVQFTTTSETVDATAGTFSVTVTLSAASPTDTSIPFTVGGTAAAGIDYSGLTASPLVIPAGQTSATITGALVDDPGANKTLTFTLGAPTNATLGATTTNTLTITEPLANVQPEVGFISPTETVNAADGTFSITVQSLQSATDVTIPFTVGGTAVAGVDYTGLTASPLVIPAGQSSVTITGKLLSHPGSNQTLTFILGTPTNALLGTIRVNTLTISEPAVVSQPTVQFATTSETVDATAGTFNVTVNLSTASATATTIPFTIGGTAAAGTDYTGLTASPLVIPAGQTSATITGTLVSHPGNDQTLTFTLGTPTNATLGGSATNTLTIHEAKIVLIATGASAGNAPEVKVFNADGSIRFDFMAYAANFTGGVTVAVGDVNGDGVPDIITGAGPGGGPRVEVFDGVTGALIGNFFAYSPTFTGGVYVAVGDVNGDGKDDIITGAGAGGGPHVKVFDGATGATLQSFFAYSPTFTGGVTVAAGDVNGDGKADIITGAGPGGGPQVNVFDGATGAVLQSFFAYDVQFTGGVYVAAGDFKGDGVADIATGADVGGGPHVKIFDAETGAAFQSFFAGDSGLRNGVTVAAGDVNGDGKDDVITSVGAGGGPHVIVFDATTNATLLNLSAYPASFVGGVYVGSDG